MKIIYTVYNLYPMKRTFLFITALMYLFSNYTIAQSIQNFNTSYPASSQALSLGDLSNINNSTDLYTGKLNYAINLKTVTFAGINIPIGIHYTTSGFKVQEVAGNTGLGWGTSFNGVITRSVQGLPDDYYYGYCGPNRTGGSYYGDMNKQLLEKSANNEWDSEPDRFFFSFLGFSGSFVLDPDGNPLLQSSMSGIKIIRCPFTRNNNSAPFNQWILIDQLGNQYIFGEEDSEFTINTNHHEKTNSNDFYRSSWYIKKIITANHQEVNFTYTTNSSVTYTNYVNMKREVNNSNICSENTAAIWTESTDANLTPLYLSQISGQNTTIEFNYNHDRLDLANGKALTDIQVKYSGKLMNHYVLDYGYFTSDDGSNTKRLKLNNLYENFLGVNSKRLYTFYYNEQTNLPARNSVKTDYWGYYNSNASESNINTRYATKAPDETLTKSNVLVKAVNPFGGSSNFIYELNQYRITRNVTTSAVGGLRIKTTYDKKVDTDNSLYNRLEYNYNRFDGTDPNISSGQVFVTINSTSLYNVSYNCGNRSGTETYYSSELLRDLFDVSGSPIGYSQVTIKKTDGSSTRYSFTNYSDYPNDGEKGLFSLHPFPSQPNGIMQDRSYDNKYPTTSYAFARGKPLTEEQVNNNGEVVKKTAFSYELTSSSGLIYGIKPYIGQFTSSDGPSSFNYGRYKYFTQDLRLVKKDETYFKNNNQQQQTSETYAYTDYAKNLLRSVSNNFSGGKIDKSTFRYPFDIVSYLPDSDPGINSPVAYMTYNNIIANPAEVIHSVIKNSQENIVSANITQYAQYNTNCIYPNTEFKLETRIPIPVNEYAVSSVNNFSGPETLVKDGRFRAFTFYDSYDNLGNVSQVESQTNSSNQINSATNKFGSMLYGYNGLYKIAEISNAKQDDIAYTSFESDEKGNWNFGGIPEYSVKSVTGKYCYNLSHGPLVKSNLNNGKTYLLTYWTKNTQPYNIAGTQGNALLLQERNGWRNFQHKLAGVNAVNISGPDFIDEVRLYPAESKMTTYTYEPFIGLTSKTNENGQSSYNEYDECNRLAFVKDNNKNILKAVCYNYQGEQVNCFGAFSSSQQSGLFYKNDCGPGYGGNQLNYVVEAGRYTASTQAAADALAQNDVNLYGQRYTNANGSCTQQTIYARLTTDNYVYSEYNNDQDNYGSSTTGTLSVSFYSDAAGTIPFNLTVPLNIIVEQDIQNYAAYGGSSPGSSNTTYTIPSGVNYYFLGNVSIDNYQTYTDPYSGYGHVSDSSYFYYNLIDNGYYVILTQQ